MNYQGTDYNCTHDGLLVDCSSGLHHMYLETGKEISDYEQKIQKFKVVLSCNHVSYVSKRIPITGSLWPPSGWSRWPLNVKLLHPCGIPTFRGRLG